MNEIIEDNIDIYTYMSCLKYKTDDIVYKIRMFEDVRRCYNPILYITYRKTGCHRKFVSQLNHRVPLKHANIVSSLFQHFEDKIVLPLKLTGNINYKNDLVFPIKTK